MVDTALPRSGKDLPVPGESIGARIAGIALAHPLGRRWWIAFAGAMGLLGLFAVTVLTLLFVGVGIWDNNNAVVWALDIASYDWWIGIACGGVMVSGVLLLTGADGRGAINRVAETTALLCTFAAGLYPIIHLGRPWFFYWNLPYPNTLALWPQFRSPLVWDATNIVSFLVVGVSLWYVGLLPDLATLRDRAAEAAEAKSEAAGRRLRVPWLKAHLYGIAAAGWRGSASHWQLWVQAYRTIALLAVILVVSLQTGASVMLAGSVLPGWHDTLLPLSFLVNAVFSGVGVVAALTVLVRAVFGLEAVVTERHVALLARLLLGLGLASLYGYAAEMVSTALHGDAFARATLARRVTGPQAWAFWTVVTCALVPVHLLWIGRAQSSPLLLALIGILVAIGAYADHVMVLVVTLTHDFLPASALDYRMGIWGIATFLGSVGLFLVLLLLFLRYLPVVSIVGTRQPGAGPIGDGASGTETALTESEARDDVPLWGVSAEFASQGALAAAMRALAGQHADIRLDAYGPEPIPQALAALDRRDRSIRPYALAGALIAGGAFLAMCVYATVYAYAFDIGGRPRWSWPSFVVPSLSVAMMGGTLAVHAVFLFVNRLPRLNHPAFNIPGFGRVTQDRYFLAAEARGDSFDDAAIERRLAALPPEAGRPLAIRQVPR